MFLPVFSLLFTLFFCPSPRIFGFSETGIVLYLPACADDDKKKKARVGVFFRLIFFHFEESYEIIYII